MPAGFNSPGSGLGAVEEVGPRVIREQLGAHIPAERLPTGSGVGPAPTATKAGKSRRTPTAAAAKPAEGKTYKPGWAKPKIKPKIKAKPTARARPKRG